MKDKDKLSLCMELDKSDYHLKLIAKDKSNIFRVFSEALYFSESHYKEIRDELYSFIQQNANTLVENLSLLKDISKVPIEEMGNIEPEITLTLLAFIYGRNLVLLYSDENWILKKYILDFNFAKTAFISILDNNGFNSVYTREHIKNWGFAQSVLIEIINKALNINKQQNENTTNKLIKKTDHYI